METLDKRKMEKLLSLPTIDHREFSNKKKLGRGGFGVVYEAKWLGGRVAIKQLEQSLTPELLIEFKKELEVHSRLQHPNVVALYGMCEGPMAFVLELMTKGSLYDVLHSSENLPWLTRINIAFDMISGLSYLHTQDIIHRDLKSLNILIDEHMRAKIADFGLAKIRINTTALTVGPMGTALWMAPELLSDPDVKCDRPTDIYAIGVILWEISSRKLPYENTMPIQAMIQVARGFRENIPTETPLRFANLISQCWEQRADDRPTIEKVKQEMELIKFSKL